MNIKMLNSNIYKGHFYLQSPHPSSFNSAPLVCFAVTAAVRSAVDRVAVLAACKVVHRVRVRAAVLHAVAPTVDLSFK